MQKQLKSELPAPHAAQRQVLAEAKRFNVLACGRRWGKTVLGGDRIVRAVLEGFPVAWFSPTFKMELETWRGLQDTLAPIITSRNNAEYRLEVRGGGSKHSAKNHLKERVSMYWFNAHFSPGPKTVENIQVLTVLCQEAQVSVAANPTGCGFPHPRRP